MRCYFVNVCGRLAWSIGKTDPDAFEPAGLSGLRYVLASNETAAVSKAIDQIEADLVEKYGWDCAINPTVDWSVEEVRQSSYFKLLSGKYGFIFNREE
ncbi:MAG: hypothetical protein WA918_02655 [Erythrobacter sp.]